MSEKITTPEQKEVLASNQAERLSAQAAPEKPAKAEKDPGQTASEARAAIAETTRNESRLNPLEELEAATNTPRTAQPQYIDRELKTITLRRELQTIRRKLPLPQKALSKVIHQPVIRVASEAAGKTVSRPSGLLGGGLVAFMGTSSYLYLAKHMGFRYNYVVFLLLFTAGFIVGLALELLVHLATSSRRRTE
ncbi:hypothetical protein COY17_02725 [Candidatus Saccharibacteria bacterium CG_4_10_14_0_2_um_filter_52_9]|nr:MAG: hypothetical protein COY17_02725 [Candidatus Saccharibacteria bacterium CG_4_10_14_0_2_um_filter_52_9]